MSSSSKLYEKITLNPQTGKENISSKMYKGFSTINSKTENFALYDFQLIQQDLINHFHVRQGERLMNPTFGTIIWDLIFEPLTSEVKSLITQNVDAILNAEPRVQATQIMVTPYDNGIQIQCVLKYLPYNISQQMQFKFDKDNGLLMG